MIIIIQRKYFITIANVIIHTTNTDLIDNTELYKSYLFFLNLKAMFSNTKKAILTFFFPLENNVMYKTLDEKIYVKSHLITWWKTHHFINTTQSVFRQ